MLRNLADAWAWLEKLYRRVERLEAGAFLENASVTNGRLRFIGGVLRLDSGALLELIGQWRFFGNGAITGDVVAEGKWTQNGPWEFNGDGDIDGDVDLTGVIRTGNVRIEDGKIYVGSGASQIVIDGATGRIIAGDMAIDPTDGGSVTFPGGAKLAVGLTGGSSSIGMVPGGSVDVSANTITAWMRALGASISVSTASATITAPNVFMPELPPKPSGLVTVPVSVDPETGKLYAG